MLKSLCKNSDKKKKKKKIKKNYAVTEIRTRDLGFKVHHGIDYSMEANEFDR